MRYLTWGFVVAAMILPAGAFAEGGGSGGGYTPGPGPAFNPGPAHNQGPGPGVNPGGGGGGSGPGFKPNPGPGGQGPGFNPNPGPGPGDGRGGGGNMDDLQRRKAEMEIKGREDEMRHLQQVRQIEQENLRTEVERRRRELQGHNDGPGPAILLLPLYILVINILLTVWVCKDMSEQKIGRALWVPLVLMAGMPAAILYAIARIADTRPKSEEPPAKSK